MYALTRINIIYLISKHYHWFLYRYLNDKFTPKMYAYLNLTEIITLIKKRQINIQCDDFYWKASPGPFVSHTTA